MPKIALMFPGQGAQYVGMGKDLAEQYPEARAVFEQANEAVDFDLLEVLWNGTEEQLQLTEVTQPAILATSIACLEVLKTHGVAADIVAGLSLGEYAALVAAGSLDFATAIPLVQRRGQYMQEAVPAGKGTMAAIIGLTDEQVATICNQCQAFGVVEPANFNCPGQVVVAGEVAAVEEVAAVAAKSGARKTVILPVSAPFHCSLLAPAGKKLANDLRDIDIKAPQLPVVSNVHAQQLRSADEVYNDLVEQVSSAVRWAESVEKMIELGADTFIEVGPGRSLKGFLRRIDRKKTCYSVQDVPSLLKTIAQLQGEAKVNVAG